MIHSELRRAGAKTQGLERLGVFSEQGVDRLPVERGYRTESEMVPESLYLLEFVLEK